MSEAYEHITSGNEDYKKNKQRYIFLYHSYMGGDVYKKGEYLTKYTNESEAEFEERVATTPLDNNVAGVVSLYNSFLFRQGVNRDYGSLSTDPTIQDFERDADLDGRSLTAFMKEANTLASVFGMTWIVISKENVGATTLAEEVVAGVRPYLSVVSPLMMLDWNYTKTATGRYELDYCKYIEEETDQYTYIKEWYPDSVITTVVDHDRSEVKSVDIAENQLGMIPVIAHYSKKSIKRGYGISLISDIADLQRACYNEYSEIEQTIRLSNAASLVKTADTEAGAGPGAIIHIPDNLPGELRPYLLQPQGTSVDAIYKSIHEKTQAMDRIAHLGAIRETTARTMSGISRQMEFEQLNAALAEIADNLELTEEQIMKIYAQYQATVWDGVIEYPDSFNIRDAAADLEFYAGALAINIPSDVFRQSVQKEIVKTVLGADSQEYRDIANSIEVPFEPHTMISPSGESVEATTHETHLALAAQGYTHQ